MMLQLAACRSNESTATKSGTAEMVVSPSPCPTGTCRHISVVAAGAGKACNVNGNIGPPSYLANSIGRPGIPHLNETQRAQILEIMKYVHSSTLRFAFVGGEFVVYDAKGGPCIGSPYSVMNFGCNEFYSTTDFDSASAEGTHAGLFGRTGACTQGLRPWTRITPDKS